MQTQTFPTVLDSPVASVSRSLSKLTSYSYMPDGDDDAILDVTSFSVEGFSDFDLDLTCLSPPPSPPPSPRPPAENPFSSCLPSSPPSYSRRSVSFSADPPPIIQRPASAPRLSTSPRISLTSTTTPSNAAWTLSKYVGRGTPIDPGRRSEWAGGDVASLGDATEDGVLFSTVRSTSMDFDRELGLGFGFSPSHGSVRSISPLTEWNYISPPPRAHTFAGRGQPRSTGSVVSMGLTPLPESAKIQVEGLNPDASAEWASSMRAALSTSNFASASTPALSSETHEPTSPSAAHSADDLLRTPNTPHAHTDADDHDNVPTSECEHNPKPVLDSSLHAAVEQGLGLIPGGMTWFDVGILPGPSPIPGPASTSGRASTELSMYSCDQDLDQAQLDAPFSSPHRSRSRSHSADPSEIRTELEGRAPLRSRASSRIKARREWWRRFLRRLRRLQSFVLRRRESSIGEL